MKTIRLGIAVLVAFSVLAHGATEVWAQSVVVLGTVAFALLWGFVVFREGKVEISWNPLYLPLVGFGLFVLVQWLFGLSVYPYLTKIELLKLVTYFSLFFLASQSFRTREEVKLFVWFLLFLGFVVALFGILQFFSFNGKIYWFREIRYGRNVFGPYVNRNHFAGLMELIIPIGLAVWFLRAVSRDRLLLVVLFTTIPVGALFLSASRGGILSFVFQFCLLALLISIQKAHRKWLPAAAGAVMLVGMFVTWLGYERALGRFGQLWGQEISENVRTRMFADTWRIFLDHPWVGTGLGTFVTVYPQYASSYEGRLVDHAHNDYVEMMAETGMVGVICSLAFIVILFRTALSNLRPHGNSFSLAIRIGSLVACSGLLLHSLVDFNMHIPSNALLFFLLASLATNTELNSRPKVSPAVTPR